MCAIAAAVAWWIPPSDVVELVCDQSEVLVGRYSENRFFVNLLTSLPLALIGGLLVSRVRFDRLFAFKAIAVALGALLAFVVVDVALRFARDARYEETDVASARAAAPQGPQGPQGKKPIEWPHDWEGGSIKRRPPNTVYENIATRDRPPGGLTYPNRPAGYLDGKRRLVTLTVDERGFRNPPGRQQSEIVVLGDSFAEGSEMTDADVWPRLLERELGRSVYNLGISGGSPRHSVNNLLAFADELAPKVVLCLVYEGNDFKVHKADEKISRGKAIYDVAQEAVKDSPVIKRLRSWLVDTFEGVRSDAPIPGWDSMGWMPVALRFGGSTSHVAFKPNRVERLYVTEDEFARSKGWAHTVDALRALKEACASRGARLVFVFAPDAPHVVLPLVADEIPAEGLHRFADMELSRLPPPAEFKQRFFERVESQERVFARYCADEGIEFVSLTEPLRDAIRRGEQVYFTYDQHWSPLGHVVAANAIAAYLRAQP